MASDHSPRLAVSRSFACKKFLRGQWTMTAHAMQQTVNTAHATTAYANSRDQKSGSYDPLAFLTLTPNVSG